MKYPSLAPYLLCFSFGVFLTYQVTIADSIVAALILGVGLFFGYRFSLNTLPFIFFAMCFFGLGIARVTIDQKLPKNHYSIYTNNHKKDEFEFRITKKLRTNDFQYRFYADLFSTNTNASRGKVLLIIDKSKMKRPNVDETYHFMGNLTPLQAPKNPFEFDYRRYLNQKGIYHQIIITEKEQLHYQEYKPNRLNQFKTFLNEKISKSKLAPTTQITLKTMLLGQGQDMNQNTRQNFVDAGVIHLFAISGLHVGLLMLMFQWILGPLQVLPYGKIGQSLGTLLLLWGYAFLIGGESIGGAFGNTFFVFSGWAVNFSKTTNCLFGFAFHGSVTLYSSTIHLTTGFSDELFGRIWHSIPSTSYASQFTI